MTYTLNDQIGPLNSLQGGTDSIKVRYPGQLPIKFHNSYDQSTFRTTFIEKLDPRITKAGHNIGQNIESKDSFLRALREVAPEMELFLENHGQYIRNFLIKL